jgi:hypothetical protein
MEQFMPLPDWSGVRESLTAAIRDALPLQVRKADGDQIAGIGLHMDAYYGSAGLYLLPKSIADALSPDEAANIGDWPISTDWDGREDHAIAFAAHWGRWDRWFYDHLDDLTGAEGSEKFRKLLRISCEATRAVETAGMLADIPKADGFRIIIAEHDEPNELALERYELFVRSGVVRCHGEVDEPIASANPLNT